MADGSYVFSAQQGAFLDALKDGRYRGSELTDYGKGRISLQDQMPPVYQQAMRGTCVANAATALLEYYEDRKVRLSVQFLYEMTKSVERKWLDANLQALGENRDVDAEFAAKFPAQVAQVRLTTDANGAGSPAAKAFLNAFARQLGEYFNDNSGSQIKRCFEAIRDYGTCRYSLWPYANMQSADSTSGGSLPPGSLEDAVKHRVLTGLYLLRSPNNVDEIRGIVAGANGRRPMPVCVGLPLFEDCDGTDFRFPAGVESEGRLVSKNALKGVHEMLIVGFEDDRMVAGGGWFIVRNSWGSDWGKDGYGRVPYAYVECFCTEAGTILQDMVDYVGDGYGAKADRKVSPVRGNSAGKRNLGWLWFAVSAAVVAILAVLVALSIQKNRKSSAACVDCPVAGPSAVTNQPGPDAREPEKPNADEEARRQAEKRRLAAEKRQAEERRIAEEKRQTEERRLAEERRALEAEKTRLAQERRMAEERAAAEAKAARIAAEKAAREAAEKRAEAERQEAAAAEKRRLEAEQAEKRRQAEEAEKRRLAGEAEKRRQEEAKVAAERAKVREYLVHVTLVCQSEVERDAVVRCLNGFSGSVSGGMTNGVENLTVVEYEKGRNLIGIAQKGYRVRCDVRMTGAGDGIRRPTDEVKRLLGLALNENCQFEGEDRIDWSNFTRMSCQQDFTTASGRSGSGKNPATGVRIGF